MLQFLALGGAGEIGANCYYLKIAGTGILLDCGMHPKKTGVDALPEFKLLEDKPIDYVLISHAHQDHLNGLPFLIKKFPHIKIITTPQTRAIAELTLRNAITILKRQVNKEQFEIYSYDEVDLLIQSIQYKAYGEKFRLKSITANDDDFIEAEFYDAGHILGSAGILLKHKKSSVFYTGDINLSGQTLLNGAALPNFKVDTLITETTYGATDSSGLLKWDKELERFSSSINKIINNGGSILIPVFSLGKMQEMLASIWLLMKKRKLVEVDIFTGGLGRKINRVYDYNRYTVKRNEQEIILHDIPQKDLNGVTNPAEFIKSPSIVLASSGMMIENTNSFLLAKHFLAHKKSAIFTVGYMDEETPGYKVANARKGDKIKLAAVDKEIEVKCIIKNFRFSAHSKREEIIKIAEKLNPQNILLVHGDNEAINYIGMKLKKQFPAKKVYVPGHGEEKKFD